MIEAFVTVKDGKIAGRTAADAEALGELADGEYRAQFTQPGRRSLSQLALYWVMCGMLADNAPEPDDGEPWTKEAVSDVLKIGAGHVVGRMLADGTLVLVPKSVAFNKMEAPEFSTFLDRAFDVAARKFGPELSDAVCAELMRLMQPEQRAAA